MSADNALHETSFHEIFKSIKVFWSFHIKVFQIFSQQNLRPLVPNVNWFLLGNCKLFFSYFFFIQVFSNSTYIYRKQLDFHTSFQISFMKLIFQVGVSPSKKVVFTFFNESSLKNDTNAFYLMLEVLFVLEIFRFLSRLFGYEEKQFVRQAQFNFKIYDVTVRTKNNYKTYCPICYEKKATRKSPSVS